LEKILIFDSTLRDGSHAIKHQLEISDIKRYCLAIDNAGLYTVIIGHGNGLGASSLQVGLSKFSDNEMLKTARNELKKTKMGVLLIPGFGTIKDNIKPAIDIGVDIFCVAIHCTEANVTKQHIQYIRNENKEVYGVLMMAHMVEPKRLLSEALKMQEYGAIGVIIMDSAGNMLPKDAADRVKLLVNNLEIKVGFHAHNNLSLAMSNSLVALENGATIIDGTLRGLGAGAGNCQLEVLAGIINAKLKIETRLDLYKLMDISDEIVSKIMVKPQEISSISLISGLSGVFSSFATQVKIASERFKVDPRDIFVELGRRKILAGQEDFIVDIAMNLAQQKVKGEINYDIESLL